MAAPSMDERYVFSIIRKDQKLNVADALSQLAQ